MRSAAAYVNHGRWVVECPSDSCAAAMISDGPLLICDCRDQEVCDHGRPCGEQFAVEIPDEWADVWAVLESRPKVNRNWSPGETVRDLKRENLLHGVRI